MIIEQLCKKFNIKFVILRFGTVYGERANKFNIKNFVDNAKKYKKIFRNTRVSGVIVTALMAQSSTKIKNTGINLQIKE